MTLRLPGPEQISVIYSTVSLKDDFQKALLHKQQDGNIVPICWQLAPHPVPSTNIHHPPIDPIFDIYQSTRGSFTQSQLLLLFAQLSGKERQPQNLGSQFIILMTAVFAGAWKFRGQMGVRETRCLHDSTPQQPSRPWLEPPFQEGKGRGRVWGMGRYVTSDTLDILTPSC